MNLQKLVIEPFVNELSAGFIKVYGSEKPQFAEVIKFTGYLALENISNCDALYHNIEHTIMVSLARKYMGKHLSEGVTG